jgi:hypothetical protein
VGVELGRRKTNQCSPLETSQDLRSETRQKGEIGP